ncbi:hypothetical protein O988_02887 [Pseudogymnoascus sp. VKM F-3808]|nr:hypothetical protein O988_02887 [Pseudogymnoascus sp. VKM F-3808]
MPDCRRDPSKPGSSKGSSTRGKKAQDDDERAVNVPRERITKKKAKRDTKNQLQIEDAKAKACIICQRRKVKCTGMPTCDQCISRHETCTYKVKQTDAAQVNKVAKACIMCQKHKKKCTGMCPCDQCISRNKTCSYLTTNTTQVRACLNCQRRKVKCTGSVEPRATSYIKYRCCSGQ